MKITLCNSSLPCLNKINKQSVVVVILKGIHIHFLGYSTPSEIWFYKKILTQIKNDRDFFLLQPVYQSFDNYHWNLNKEQSTADTFIDAKT